MSELDERKKKRKKRKKAGTESSKESSLRDWFKRKGAKGKKGGWVDCNAPDGKGGYKSCGRSSGEKRKKYPACRPTPGACKERGRGKSWGKKSSKRKRSRKKRNENMQLTTEEIKKIIQEELTNVLLESDLSIYEKLEKMFNAADEESKRHLELIIDSLNDPEIYAWYIGKLREKLEADYQSSQKDPWYEFDPSVEEWVRSQEQYIDELEKEYASRTKEEQGNELHEKKGSKRIRKKKTKKDACYRKVKSRYKVWPSAYASGALVKCRKVGAKNWGNKSKKNENLDEEFIPGGESSKYGQITTEAMIVAIADEHGVSPEDIRAQFEMGVEEEMEHAQEEEIAQEIALDHLAEDPEYYSKLDDANLEEKKLTKKDKEQKEKYVKGMKSSKKDFKKRYGKDAESVMYATATKMAKQNESKEFKKHNMFDPKTGDKKVAKVEKDHHDLAKKGYTHIDPQDIIDLIEKEGGALGMKNLIDKFGKEQEEEILKTLGGMGNVGQHKSGDYILDDGAKIKVVSESLQYHLDHGVGVEKNVFRPGSSEFFGIFREARQLFREGNYKLHSLEEKEIIESDLGEFALYEGMEVPLDFPMLMEQDEAEFLDEKKKKKKKKDPPIGKPTKNTGGGKKYKVFVRNPKTGKIKKITYGDSKGGLKGNWNSAEARKSFASRHNCKDKKDRTKAGYWACRAHKDFGSNVPGRFW